MPAGRLFSLHVVARLRDFFDERTHWQRRLWNVGLVLSLQELLEAAEERDRALSSAAVSNLVDSVRTHIAWDPGGGTDLERSALARYVGGNLAVGGLSYEGIRVALAEIDSNYLSHWATTLRESENPPNRERTARAIGSHLLDAGRTPAFLAEWLRSLVQMHGEISAPDLCDEASVLLRTPRETFEVLLPFELEPRLKAPRPDAWIDSAEAARWLRANGHRGVRQRGGFLLSFEAHGPEEAVGRAADVADRFLARVSVGERTFGRFTTRAHLPDGQTASLIRGRRVEVRALTREEKISELSEHGAIDAALELLAHLQTGTPAVAAAAGWSAIESLLLGPGDEETRNVVAADRLAGLVACSWPRAELTDLAWARISARNDEFSQELRALPTNRERAARIWSELETNDGRLAEISHGPDIAACYRLRALFGDPRRALLDVRGHASESLRRLYRQRNLVLHSARTQAVALGAALRTASPLVGAGIDRVVHGALVRGLSPLELQAKGEFELDRAGGDGAPSVVDLLE